MGQHVFQPDSGWFVELLMWIQSLSLHAAPHLLVQITYVLALVLSEWDRCQWFLQIIALTHTVVLQTTRKTHKKQRTWRAGRRCRSTDRRPTSRCTLFTSNARYSKHCHLRVDVPGEGRAIPPSVPLARPTFLMVPLSQWCPRSLRLVGLSVSTSDTS